MNRSNTVIFEANKYRFLKIHIAGALLGGLVVCIFFEGIIIDILVIMSAFMIVSLCIFFIGTKKYDIVFKPQEIEGPIRNKTREKRISVPYELLDTVRSTKPSLFKSGFIATKDGTKILLYSLYFSPTQIKLIFDEFNKRVSNAANSSIK